MGRSLSLILLRVSGILVGGMLLFAVFATAHGENLDGYGIKPAGGAPISNYGMVPLPGDNTAAPNVTAANGSYDAAPVSGGYNSPAPYGYAAAPAGGFTPAPPLQAAAQYQPPPANTAPQPQYQQPAAPAADYGYKPMPQAQAAPRQVAAAVQPVPRAADSAYGYRAGDGVFTTQPTYPAYPAAANPQANGYYQSLGYQPQGQMRANPDYVLGPGDKIKLTVFGETDLSGDFTLDGSGNLALPLVGQVRAAGYTAPQLEATIGSAMSQGYLKSPRISVEVATYRPFYIIGAVNRPGEYPYVNHMNALNAIALAGGYTNTAVESVVYVRREGSNTEIRMPTDRSTQIYPGDVIRVHNTFFSDAMSLLSPLSGPAGIVAATAITTP